MINFVGLQFASTLAGLQNYENDTFNFPVNGHVLVAGATSSWSTTWPINNTNAVSTIQLQYSLDNVWRFMAGAITISYASGTYEVETLTYYSGTVLNVRTYVINQTGGSVTIPQFDVTIRASLFNAPF